MLGQTEYYINVNFVLLNYDSLYLEMVQMFPNLKVETYIEEQLEAQDTTVNIIDSMTVSDVFEDYKKCGRTLERLC